MFNAKETKENLIKWIKDWFLKNGNEKTIAIIGISGGKDSSICAALLKEALGKERVLGVLMPNGIQSDIDDSLALCKILDLNYVTINIGKTFDSLTEELVKKTKKPLTSAYKTNTPSRLRMTTLYSIAALYQNARVCNTGNLSERLLGYTTIYGDFAGDFAPLKNLTKTEVVELGLTLNLPRDLVLKAPGDGMSGLTDEDNFGFTYEEVDKYVREGVKGENYAKIKARMDANAFKNKTLNIVGFGDDNL